MEKFVICGKGGIGKSTIAANLSAIYAISGYKVLLIGCDPKHDSTIFISKEATKHTVMHEYLTAGNYQIDLTKCIYKGKFDVDCIEAGGPDPGVGCGGRSISLMLDLFTKQNLLENRKYDIVIFDILGDVVCGGFAAPLRKGFGEKVFIVVSAELLPLYAANNIAKAICSYSANGIVLGGLIGNLRNNSKDHSLLEKFSKILSTKILQFIPRDNVIKEAEYQEKTIIEYNKNSNIVSQFKKLSKNMLKLDTRNIKNPTPVDDHKFYEYAKSKFIIGKSSSNKENQ